MTEEPGELEMRPLRRSWLSQLSPVWLVPLGAVVISLALAWQHYAGRGPVIEITFGSASGIREGQTELRYRDVRVGLVESVGFADNLREVLVRVRLDRDTAPYVDADSQFWVVRPQVSARGVSGLDTVLGGVYIEGSWDSEIGVRQNAFAGLDSPPANREDLDGVLIALRANDAFSLRSGAPVLYRGIEVGSVETPELAPDGNGVIARAFIHRPYDSLVTTETRFWNTSGVDLTLGPGGVEVSFQSLATILSGGITFDTLISGGSPIEPGQEYRLFEDEDQARANLFSTGEGARGVDVSFLYDGSVQGLTPGAAVEYRGIRVGEVVSLSAYVPDVEQSDRIVRLLVTARLQPGRLGLGPDAGAEETYDFLDQAVSEGLRGRLATASILTGGLKVELVETGFSGSRTLDRDAEPFPAIPTVAAAISNVSQAAEGVLDRIEALPVEELMEAAINALDSVTLLARDEDLQRAPGELNGLLVELRGIVGSDSAQGLPVQAGAVLEDIREAVADLRALMEQVEQENAIATLADTLRSARDATGRVAAATERLPALLDRVDAVLAGVAEVPLADLSADMRAVLGDVRAVTSSEGVQALPDRITAALAELQAATGDVRGLLGTLRDEKAAETLTQALASANAAAESLSQASAGTPELVERLNALAAKAEDLPLKELAEELRGLVGSADGVLSADGATEVPGALAGALDEVDSFLAALREGGLVENANAALGSARNAADRVADATEALPALAERLNALVRQAELMLAAYDGDSPLNREARAALRDISAAAEAVESLSRAIERRPNSIILGR